MHDLVHGRNVEALPYSCTPPLEVLNSTTFVDIGTFVKLKCSKNKQKQKIVPKILPFGNAIRENKIAENLEYKYLEKTKLVVHS